ncbi:MAG: HAMP domain-containing histidine kinase [Desulfobacteraceae bacterium]|nr:HAMP domain-containing histidine kinase [Desulfobacteraceae bacterium]
MKSNIKIMIFGFLVAFVIVIGLLHTLTPGYMILYHDTYRRLSYFPITIGAILYGIWGGISLAILSCLAFVPHLFLFWAEGPEAYYSELSEILFYLAAGIVIGLISSRENKLREKYKTLSEKLGGSYQRLHEQASQLIEAEKQLGKSQKLSMLGHVSASLAHEIKNPLASIKGAAEILADEVPENHPKHEFIEIMRSEISRLNHSVEDVLKYCRGLQHEDISKQEPVEKIINHVVSVLETGFKDKLIAVTIQPKSDDHPFSTNEAAVTQVLMNILINAVDAVEINGKIMIDFGQHEKGCLIRVSDDGPGIDNHMAKEVFQSFVTFKEEGTGLGLFISKRIIESLGGKIYIEKSSLGGAAFNIYIPEKMYSSNETIE